MLPLLEVRQYACIVPALVPMIMPPVVVQAVAADVDHGVDGAGAAEHFPARPVQPAPAHVGLLFGVVGPVAGGFDQFGKGYGDMDLALLVRAAGLQEKDTRASLFGKPVRQDAPGRASADDDVVHHDMPPRLLA